jgi:16S rRNA (uracil1498-N3)-methyltransferase
MRHRRLYLPLPLAIGMPVFLDGASFNHAIRVLRLQSGAPLTLFNGEGGEFHAVLETVERRRALARIDSFDPREIESPLKVSLAQGLSKGERMDYTLQKAVELGVDTILPLFTERSTGNLAGERLANRLNHWRRVVIGACEQCGRNRLPIIREPLELHAWLMGCPDPGLRLVLDPLAGQGLKDISYNDGAITLLIGPEGGLSPQEIALTEQADFIRARLGPRIMRTETAGVTALAALQTLWGDLG